MLPAFSHCLPFLSNCIHLEDFGYLQLHWRLPSLLSRCLSWAPHVYIHSFNKSLLCSYYMPGAEDRKTDNSRPRRSPASLLTQSTHTSSSLHVQCIRTSACWLFSSWPVFLSPDLICSPVSTTCRLSPQPSSLCPHYLCVSSGLTPLTWTLQWAPGWPPYSRLMSVYCLWSLIRRSHIRRNSCVITVCCSETQQRCLLGAGCHQTNRLYF